MYEKQNGLLSWVDDLGYPLTRIVSLQLSTIFVSYTFSDLYSSTYTNIYL